MFEKLYLGIVVGVSVVTAKREVYVDYSKNNVITVEDVAESVIYPDDDCYPYFNDKVVHDVKCCEGYDVRCSEGRDFKCYKRYEMWDSTELGSKNIDSCHKYIDFAPSDYSLQRAQLIDYRSATGYHLITNKDDTTDKKDVLLSTPTHNFNDVDAIESLRSDSAFSEYETDEKITTSEELYDDYEIDSLNTDTKQADKPHEPEIGVDIIEELIRVNLPEYLQQKENSLYNGDECTVLLAGNSILNEINILSKKYNVEKCPLINMSSVRVIMEILVPYLKRRPRVVILHLSGDEKMPMTRLMKRLDVLRSRVTLYLPSVSVIVCCPSVE